MWKASMAPRRWPRPPQLVRALPITWVIGYLLISQRPISALSWVVALGSAAVSLAGARWPCAVLLTQSALLVIASRFCQQECVEAVVLLTLAALAELASRRRGWPLAAGFTVASVVMWLAASRWQPFVSVWLLVLTICMMLVPLLIGIYVRSVRALAKVAQERAVELERQRELLDASIRTAERTAIARELHDILAHHVSSIIIRVNGAQHSATALPADLSAVLSDVHAAATTGLAQLQQLLSILRDPNGGDHELDPVVLAPTELEDALRQLVTRAHRHIDVDLVIKGQRDALDPVEALALLRVVQESLTNAVKHSPAGSHTTVTLDASHPRAVTLRVETIAAPGSIGPGPGPGFAPPPGSGWGLVGMHERITLLGGTLHAGPSDTGWRVEATLASAGVGAVRNRS